MPNNPEKQLQNTIERYLILHRVFFWKNNTGALRTENRFIRFGAVGSPDICVIKEGKFIGLEVKTEKGKQSDMQKEFEMNLKEAGGEYFIVQSLEDLQALGF